MTFSLKEHWNQKYADTPISQLGWYEPKSIPSLNLIERCGIPHASPIIDIGSGASMLIPDLLALGYHNISAVDISDVALQKARALLDTKTAARVNWMVDDITHPSARLQKQKAAIWHDRAVFHFLTTEQYRRSYFSTLQQVLELRGFVIIAAFGLNGVAMCSGLPVQRYDVQGVCEFLGKGFTLIESIDYTYQMPSGDLRPFIYVLLQKISGA